MKTLITGVSSGVGQQLLLTIPNSIGLTRNELDLSIIEDVKAYDLPEADMFINCAGTDIDGKIEFINHSVSSMITIMNTNLISPMILSKKALEKNQYCKIVNITSTNNNRYYPSNLTYSLSKLALSDFGKMLQIEYPALRYLEVRLGLTKTAFNKNRFKNDPSRFQDIYEGNPHLLPKYVAEQLASVIYNDNIKFIEIAP